MNLKEKYFLEQLQTLPKNVAPGFLMQVFQHGKMILDVEWGEIYKYYDLASLTKIMFTVPWMMKAVEDKKIKLSDPVNKYLPWYPHATPIQNLLTHTGGNDWWQPFYKSIDLQAGREAQKSQLRELLKAQSPSKNFTKAVYSDIDFLLLGFLVESIYEKEWSVLADELFSEFGIEGKVFFNPENKLSHPKKSYAPTEDCSWRKETLQGQVHDENTWALGGVAPQAGLFGTIQGVSQWGLNIRKILLGQSKWLSASTLKKFIARATPAEQGDWGLGFVLPTPGSSSSGSHFSPASFGHTGFTGTSFWFDPEHDVFISILSNRVCPTRKNEEFKKWRPRLHDWAMESLKK